MSVERRDNGDVVSVVYGTSQNLTPLKTGEVAITQAKNPAAYALAGLAYDTKFNFKIVVDLPWTDRYFKVPPRSPHGNNPKIGTLHATILHAMEVGYRAAESRWFMHLFRSDLNSQACITGEFILVNYIEANGS